MPLASGGPKQNRVLAKTLMQNFAFLNLFCSRVGRIIITSQATKQQRLVVHFGIVNWEKRGQTFLEALQGLLKIKCTHTFLN